MAEDPCGWVKLFHPSGVQVTLPLLPGISEEYAKEIPKSLFDQCAAYMAVGFLANAPGLEEGEQIEEVGGVLRAEFEKDNEITPVILLYSTNDKLEYSFLKVYLNKDEDIAAFQKASGLRLNDMPIYEGQDKLKRDGSKLAKKYIVTPPRPFKAVLKKNPRYNEDDRKAAVAKGEVYRTPARIFVHWHGQGPQPADAKEGQTAGQQQADEIAKEVAWWKAFFANDPSYDEVNDHIRRLLIPMQNKEAKQMVWSEVIEPWKNLVGAEWNKEAKGFVPPKEPDNPF